ncbi:MAG TPA: adenylate/guanylate cyclase domain-containing protein [Fibrobacteraceae bacterium]|nr:adenylate/guanylate cyclase domain-containing protein [Fibrobacteraceae bacterium]
MSLTRIQLRKAKSIAFYAIAWLLACTFFFLLRFFGRPNLLDWETLMATLIQFAILSGLSHGIYEVFVLGDGRFQRPWGQTLIMRLLFFSGMLFANILAVFLLWSLRESGEMFSPAGKEKLCSLIKEPEAEVFILYAFVIAFAITFVRSVTKKFGFRVMANALLGKFQDAVEEERIFLFLDLRSATTLAEEIGHEAYSAFLREYFHLVSNCCEENHGEIYQFAGDGVILSWPMRICRKTARPLTCFQDLVICFRNCRPWFEKRFHHSPQFKAAIHIGRVISTEVGNFGSAMAYHGDTLNTTARIQALCNLLKKDLLVSDSFVRKMPNLAGYRATSQGTFQLKGKNQDLEIFSME